VATPCSVWICRGDSNKHYEGSSDPMQSFLFCIKALRSDHQALTRIEQWAEENRVLLIAFNLRHATRKCSSCEAAAKENKRGEKFRPRCCGDTEYADVNGARNIIAGTRGNSQQFMVAEALQSREVVLFDNH
jgi:hypothetical protein